MTNTTAPEQTDDPWAELAKSLMQAHKVSDEFTAFTQPLAAKLQRLFGMLQTEVGAGRFEPYWYRPNFFVSPPAYDRSGLHIGLKLRNARSLSFEDLGKRGLGVIGYHSNGPNTTQVRLNLNGAYHQQEELARNNWKACFSDAQLLVDSAIASVENNAPLSQGLTWREALREQLEHERPRDYDHKRWSDWVARWGTPDMQESFAIAQSLFDVRQDHAAWKQQLLSSWSFAPTLELAYVTSALFEPAAPN